MSDFAIVNVSVSSHYREDSYSSEIVAQGILGERVEIIDHQPLFSKIKQQDGYISWISTDQLVIGDIDRAKDKRQVRSHFAAIREEPSMDAVAIREVVIGSMLHTDLDQDGWSRVILPDGITGWIETKKFGAFPTATPENLVRLAREFLGYQYLWGGQTPKGFDCSGFVQTVFGLHGVSLPRDAWQQHEHHVISDNSSDALPGDLIFFAKTPKRITHVAISLGNNRFIHASGWIRYNSLSKEDKDFSLEHVKTFVSVNRYPLRG